jgi:hypothetical protein
MAMENHHNQKDTTLEVQQQDDDDASSLDSWGACLFVTFVTKQQQEAKPKLPSKGLQWKDDAIQDCFQFALSSHDDDDDKNNKGGPSSCSWSVPRLFNPKKLQVEFRTSARNKRSRHLGSQFGYLVRAW